MSDDRKFVLLQFSRIFVADVRRPKIKKSTIKDKFILLQFYFTFISLPYNSALAYCEVDSLKLRRQFPAEIL